MALGFGFGHFSLTEEEEKRANEGQRVNVKCFYPKFEKKTGFFVCVCVCVCVGWEGDLSRGRCNITKVLSNTIHLPGMIGCAVTAGLHFVLPVSDGHGPTDDLCAALPAYRGGGLHDFATHSFFFSPLILVPMSYFYNGEELKNWPRKFWSCDDSEATGPSALSDTCPTVVRLLLN